MRLPDHWTWDFWTADDGERHHLFFLHAPRSLGDPDLRHVNARVGHAVSTDLHHWQVLDEALAPQPAPAFDDRATWTGSCVRGPDGGWSMFHTGVSGQERGLLQRIGRATSPDLSGWSGRSSTALLEADPRWYETGDPQAASWPWHDLAWRDPWVFADPEGDGWHMLITARSAQGPADDRGVIGHARSADLVEWEAQPPLSSPGAGFGQLEVPQVEVVDGQPLLIFSCLAGEFSTARRAGGHPGGVWAVPADDVRGPFDIAAAQPLTGDEHYAGRLVQDRSGGWHLMAFRNVVDGAFVGELGDPMPVSVGPGGRVSVRASAG